MHPEPAVQPELGLVTACKATTALALALALADMLLAAAPAPAVLLLSRQLRDAHVRADG